MEARGKKVYDEAVGTSIRKLTRWTFCLARGFLAPGPLGGGPLANEASRFQVSGELRPDRQAAHALAAGGEDCIRQCGRRCRDAHLAGP